MKKKSISRSITHYLSVIIILLLTISALDSFAQIIGTGVNDQTNTYTPKKATMVFPISCTPISSPTCNYIQNNDFNTPNPGDAHNANVFSDELVLPWLPGQGSCEIYPGGNAGVNPGSYPGHPAIFTVPPVPATSFAFGAAGWHYTFNDNISESIVQKIPNIIPGHVYVLSFFIAHKNFSDITIGNIDYPLDHFNIHLISCKDYNETFHPDDPHDYSYPAIPSNSQQIYCQDNITNDNVWHRVFVHFVGQQPDPAYPLNMIWIWPQEDTQVDRVSGMFFAYPELVDLTAYANQVQQAVTPNCIATLPSCGPTGSVFTWVGPPGSTIIPPTPVNTSVTLDLNNPANAGIWTLTLSVPSADITTGACNTTGSFTTTVNVLPCGVPPVWPKSYQVWQSTEGIMKDFNGNVFLASVGFPSSSQSFNHTGHPLTIPSSTSSVNLHYTQGGYSNWINDNNEYLKFAYKSGIIQTWSGNFLPDTYRNGTTGAIVAAPYSLAANENMVAEINGGAYITSTNTNLNLYTAGGTLLDTISIGCPSVDYKFNPNTNNLFVYSSIGGCFKKFHYNGSQLLPDATVNFSTTLINSLAVFFDNQDRCFFLSDQGNNLYVLKQFDYNSPAYPNVTSSGFVNSDLGLSYARFSKYSSDKIVVFNSSNNYVYAIDFSTTSPITKKILTSNLSQYMLYFETDGQDIYLAGNQPFQTAIQIGSQNIPDLPGNEEAVFITKLNYLTDFSSFQRTNTEAKTAENLASFNFFISPNPTTTSRINLKITETTKQELPRYSITITNRLGRAVLQQTFNVPVMSIDITNFEKGIYYIEMINQKGERVTKSFVKL